MPDHVCIVSPGSLASNPRVLKEASALKDAGYSVTTVVCDYAEALRAADDDLVGRVPWKVVRVPRAKAERPFGTAWSAVARALDGVGLSVPLAVAAAAYGGPAAALRTAAESVPADLYIAHYIVALPAAEAAARRHGGMLAFDAEDYHAGEGGAGHAEPFRMKMVRRIEGMILPHCCYVTAASPLIAKAYETAYDVLPTTILNAFPLSMAPETPVRENSNGLRAYWFSQTVGLDRGLQAFMQAMALTHTVIELDIRGGDRWGHGETLMALARRLGIGDRVRLLPLAPPEQMARLAAAYDLGLSLETETSESRRLCLTNKIFTYLLAGIPVMMSDTPAQSALAGDLAQAAAVVSIASPEAMAATLDRLAAPAELAIAKSAAWRLGRERYNWDREKVALLETVASAFGRRAQERPWPH